MNIHSFSLAALLPAALLLSACDAGLDSPDPLAGGALFELSSGSAAVRVLDSRGRDVPELSIEVTGAELELRSDSGRVVASELEVGLSDIVVPDSIENGVPMHLADVRVALVGADPLDLELRWSLVSRSGELKPLAPQPLAGARLDLGFDADTFTATATIAIAGEVLDFGELEVRDLELELELE